jgi:hypothetical protein
MDLSPFAPSFFIHREDVVSIGEVSRTIGFAKVDFVIQKK